MKTRSVIIYNNMKHNRFMAAAFEVAWLIGIKGIDVLRY